MLGLGAAPSLGAGSRSGPARRWPGRDRTSSRSTLAGLQAARVTATRPPPVSAALRRKPRRVSAARSSGLLGSEAGLVGAGSAMGRGVGSVMSMRPMVAAGRRHPEVTSDPEPCDQWPPVPVGRGTLRGDGQQPAARPAQPEGPRGGPTLAEDALEALDAATRAIAEILDLEAVLQVIVDRVRELVDARYAALGIADAHGRMERFITIGIDPEVRAAIGPLPVGHGLLGVIIREGRTLRIPDISRTPTRTASRPTTHR